MAAAAAAKSLQSCPTLCNPIDGSPAGSPVPGILQARTLEWVAISFSNAWKWKAKGKSLSRVRLFATPWTAAYQAPPSMGFSRQEYWSGVPSPSLDSMAKEDVKIDFFCYWNFICFLFSLPPNVDRCTLTERKKAGFLWQSWYIWQSLTNNIPGLSQFTVGLDLRFVSVKSSDWMAFSYITNIIYY